MNITWTVIGSVAVFAGTVLAQLPERECAQCSDQFNGGELLANAVPQQKATASGAEQQLDEFPKPVIRKMPAYPEEARKEKIEGEVYVEVSIDTMGRVWNAKVLKSAHTILNQPALEAAKQWTFTPAVKNKKNVAISVTLPFKFKLSEDGGSSKKDAEGHALTQTVREILAGTNIPEMQNRILAEAYIIDRTAYLNLLETVNGRAKTSVLSEEQGRNIALVRITMNDEKDFATVVAKTEGKGNSDIRWHTVVWQKAKNGEWKIQHWHASR